MKNRALMWAVCLFLSFFAATGGAGAETVVAESTNGYGAGVTRAGEEARIQKMHRFEMDAYDEPFCISLKNWGLERELGIKVLVDLRQVPIRVDGEIFEDAYTVSAGPAYEEPVYFELVEPLDRETNHTMQVLVIASPHTLTRDVDFAMSDWYSLSFDHRLVFDPELPLQAPAYAPEKTAYVRDAQVSGFQLHPDAEKVGRYRPARELTVRPGESFALFYQALGSPRCEGEMAVFMTLGLEQASLNGQDYLLLRSKDGKTQSGEVRVLAPQEPGTYELMSWMVENPFAEEALDNPLRSAYRFTLNVVADE